MNYAAAPVCFYEEKTKQKNETINSVEEKLWK